MSIALYPGTFDPLTCGHVHLIERASVIFPKLIVGVAAITNPTKNPWFSLEERLDLTRESLSHLSVTVMSFEGLLANFANNVGAKILIRGLRDHRDYDYEVQMSVMNRHFSVKKNLETIFFPSLPEDAAISSTFVKEGMRLGASNIADLVPPLVYLALQSKLAERV